MNIGLISRIIFILIFIFGVLSINIVGHELIHVLDYKLHCLEVGDVCAFPISMDGVAGYAEVYFSADQIEMSDNFMFWSEVKAYSFNIILMIIIFYLAIKYVDNEVWLG
jgi:hypothetical protein